MFSTFTVALPAVCAERKIWLFFFFAVPYFCACPVRCSGIVLCDFEMVPVTPVFNGIIFSLNSTCPEFLL